MQQQNLIAEAKATHNSDLPKHKPTYAQINLQNYQELRYRNFYNILPSSSSYQRSQTIQDLLMEDEDEGYDADVEDEVEEIGRDGGVRLKKKISRRKAIESTIDSHW